MSILIVNNLSKSFDGVKALQSINMEIEKGQIMGMIGPNGSGKTTFFNVITGIYRSNAGEIIFKGERIEGLGQHKCAAKGISRTFQNIRLFTNLSVLDNILVGMHQEFRSSVFSIVSGRRTSSHEEKTAKEKAKDLLVLVGLNVDPAQLAVSLPYGDQRRVEIARALGSNPDLLLLDEPTAGMTFSEAEDLMELIKMIRDRGITVLMVEHNMRVMMGLADWIVVFDEGRKIAEGYPVDIQVNPIVLKAYLGEGASNA